MSTTAAAWASPRFQNRPVGAPGAATPRSGVASPRIAAPHHAGNVYEVGTTITMHPSTSRSMPVLPPVATAVTPAFAPPVAGTSAPSSPGLPAQHGQSVATVVTRMPSSPPAPAPGPVVRMPSYAAPGPNATVVTRMPSVPPVVLSHDAQPQADVPTRVSVLEMQVHELRQALFQDRQARIHLEARVASLAQELAHYRGIPHSPTTTIAPAVYAYHAAPTVINSARSITPLQHHPTEPVAHVAHSTHPAHHHTTVRSASSPPAGGGHHDTQHAHGHGPQHQHHSSIPSHIVPHRPGHQQPHGPDHQLHQQPMITGATHHSQHVQQGHHDQHGQQGQQHPEHHGQHTPGHPHGQQHQQPAEHGGHTGGAPIGGVISVSREVEAIEARGNIQVDRETGAVTILNRIAFRPRTTHDPPTAEFLHPEAANATIGDLAELSQIYAGCPMRVEGHTKGGEGTFWQTLAEDRARIVVEKMVEFGANPDFITAFGFPGRHGLNMTSTVVYLELQHTGSDDGGRTPPTHTEAGVAQHGDHLDAHHSAWKANPDSDQIHPENHVAPASHHPFGHRESAASQHAHTHNPLHFGSDHAAVETAPGHSNGGGHAPVQTQGQSLAANRAGAAAARRPARGWSQS